MDPNAHINQTSHIANTSAYNPYTGREALDILMKKVYQHLKEHQAFASHLSYTKFNYDFALTFRGEAIEPVVIKGKERHELRPVDHNFTLQGTSAPAPDDARREAGLVVPTPTLTAGGMVDIPMQSQVP